MSNRKVTAKLPTRTNPNARRFRTRGNLIIVVPAPWDRNTVLINISATLKEEEEASARSRPTSCSLQGLKGWTYYFA
jgi:hypothetical protein